jgi:hypothetical protein
LFEPDPCTPSNDDGIWRTPPDGYVAATARAREWKVIEECLAKIAVNGPQASVQ